MSINTCMIELFFIPKHSCNSRLQNGSHAQPLRFRLLFGLGWFFLSQRSPRSCFHQKPLVENPLPLSQLVEHSILELLTVEFSNTRPQMVSLISPSPHQQGNILNIELTIFMEFFFFNKYQTLSGLIQVKGSMWWHHKFRFGTNLWEDIWFSIALCNKTALHRRCLFWPSGRWA